MELDVPYGPVSNIVIDLDERQQKIYNSSKCFSQFESGVMNPNDDKTIFQPDWR